MEDQDKNILRMLIHNGRGETRTSHELATVMQIKNWPLRQGIRELIAEGLPVAAITGSNPGYFVAVTVQEAADYEGALRHRIIEDCLRLRDFKRAAKPLHQPGQLPLI